jgi:FkbM family methyltransferase
VAAQISRSLPRRHSNSIQLVTTVVTTFKRILRALAPAFLVQRIDAKKALSCVSRQPWLDACSVRKRLALDRSRFSILPPTFKHSPSFVIDVGANEGQWIGALMELLPVPKVWIFEPNPEAMKICQDRIGRRPAITYFDLALGDSAGQAELHVTAASDFASILQPRAEFLEAHYGMDAAHIIVNKVVEVATLDSLVPESQSVDLLKIDVQGLERAVLSGARRVLARTRAVLIEANLQSHYDGDDTFPALWNQLVDLGFSFWSFSSPYTTGGGKALWADAVFVKSDEVIEAEVDGSLC